MAVSSTFDNVPAGLGRALADRGFEALTCVQERVLDPALEGRDLRISSQTGSGKTVALGLVIAPHLEAPPRVAHSKKSAAPTALVVAPTRELAAQVASELHWLFRPLRAGVTVVTGGTNIAGDFKNLARGPRVVVGTPGRLLDHLRRGSINAEGVGVVVLDEADEMLDMGFRDELDGILEATPAERRTHLVSATLPREVLRLADRYQNDPVRLEGTPVGAANAEITHVAHLVYERDRLPALANLLLSTPGDQTLIFVRTRVQTSALAAELASRGFAVTALSGEMGQRERNAALAAFRSKQVRAVVATDVAARGLDINDVARVVHFDPPENHESYTHRSGRTGRAGNLGESVVFVSPSQRNRVEWMARKANMALRFEPVPTAKAIHKVADDRLVEDLDAALSGTAEPSKRLRDLAASLLAGRDPEALVAELLARSSHVGTCEPVDIAQPPPKSSINAKRGKRDHKNRNGRNRDGRGNHDRPGRGRKTRAPGEFTPFYVSWGARAGANPSRLLAMVCRRGKIKGSQVGAIRIDAQRSVVEVASHLAEDFARAAARRDNRNPSVKIAPWRG